MVLQDDYCEKCGKEYTIVYSKYCKSCQINNLKKNFANWTSGNEKIDDFIQGMQLRINSYSDIIFEWIPFNKFSEINEMGKDDFATIYSAIWEDGPLYYDKNKKEYKRRWNKNVTLKSLQNVTDEFLKEVYINFL